MGFLDRLLGRDSGADGRQAGYEQPRPQGREPHAPGASADERAVARYKYLLRTASPDQLEQIHAEAFAQLTPEQRQQVLTELSRDLPPGEQVASDQPQDLARAATRAEMRRPGYLENAFSRRSFGGGMGMGGSIMGSMMGTIGGVIIGSAIADAMFDGYDSSPEAQEAGDTAGGDQGLAGDGSANDAADSDSGGWGDTASDAGAGADSGGWGDGGSDFGGFDGGGFGGGDFGGGGDF